MVSEHSVEVRLHGALWRGASSSRADEWRRSLEEINECNDIRLVNTTPSEDSPALEVLKHPDLGLQLRLFPHGMGDRVTIELPKQGLDEHFDEYAATIQQMVKVDRLAPVRGFEALDYAKRVVHDEAGGWLKEVVSPWLDLELEDARRLFTLIFLVGSDIPEAWVRYHRAH